MIAKGVKHLVVRTTSDQVKNRSLVVIMTVVQVKASLLIALIPSTATLSVYIFVLLLAIAAQIAATYIVSLVLHLSKSMG